MSGNTLLLKTAKVLRGTMTYKEIKDRYGAEVLAEYRYKARENRRRKKAGLPPLPRKKMEYTLNYKGKKGNYEQVYDHTEYVYYRPIPDVIATNRFDEIEKIRAIVEAEVAALQKMMRKEWGKITDRAFILVVNGDNKVSKKDIIKYKVELTQLGMRKETITRFKDLCKEIIG